MVKDAFYVQKWWWPTKIRRPRAQTTPWALGTTAKPADVYLAYPQTTLESQITPSLKNKGMDLQKLDLRPGGTFFFDFLWSSIFNLTATNQDRAWALFGKILCLINYATYNVEFSNLMRFIFDFHCILVIII